MPKYHEGGYQAAGRARASSRSSSPAKGLVAVFNYTAYSHGRAVALLIVVSLIAFLPGFFQIPPIDRDEAYFAQATKQMLETGDYVDIRYRDDVRYRKPVGIYWLQAAVVKTAETIGVAGARTKIWLYRVPSLLGALGAVLATYWCALAFVGRRGAVLAALMMAVSALLGVEARLAKTDAVLLLTVVAAMAVLARAYLAPRQAGAAALDWKLAAIFWTALAAGILVKGPLILMFVGLAAATLCVLDRSAMWLRPLRPIYGIGWLLLLVLPWFVAIYWRVGGAFLIDAVDKDMLAKITGAQETHGAPPGLYLILFFVTFFPGAPLAGLAAPAVWAVRREAAARFLLAWLVPSWIVFELVATKLPHYVLPLYPAIAILIAGALETNVLSRHRWLMRGMVWWFVVPVVASIIGVVGVIVISREPGLLAWPFFTAAIVCGLFAWWLFEDDGAERSFGRAGAATILMAIGLYGVIVPALEPAFPSVALAEVLRDAPCQHPVAASVGYEEPSLVFLAGTATVFTDPSGAADFLGQGACRFAFVEQRQERAFALRAEAIGLRYDREADIEGYNISSGRPISMAVFASAAAR